MLRPEEMTTARIFDYQMRIQEWDIDAEFKPYELLGTDEFNFWYETLGMEDFWNVYDYSEFTAANILRRLVKTY